MRTIKPIKSRFRELQESKSYHESFEALKKEILSKEDGWRLPTFLKVEFEKGVFKFKSWAPLKLKKVQRILKNGNVNEHWIRIPDDFSDFKEEWEVEYFFDPEKGFPDEFNPCYDTPSPVRIRIEPGIKLYEATFIVDLRIPSTYLAKVLNREIKKLQKDRGLTGRRGRYSDDEVYEVKKLIQKGFGDTSIFRELHPQHKDFKFIQDYVIGGSEVGAKYQRTKRLIKRAKERKL